VELGGGPVPLALCAEHPRLKWLHQRQAGASNLLGVNLWGSGVVVTTSRGASNPLPIAEYRSPASALRQGLQPRRDRSRGPARSIIGVRPLLYRQDRLCGSAPRDRVEVGRLCLRSACGSSVPGARAARWPPQGFSESRGRRRATGFCLKSDFRVICCQWTAETTGPVQQGTASPR